MRDRDLFCQTGFGPVEAILVELLRRLAAPRFGPTSPGDHYFNGSPAASRGITFSRSDSSNLTKS